MNEGPVIPMHLIRENMRNQLEWCGEAPFYTLGPLTTTSRPATIISPARSRGMIGWYGLRHALLRHAERTSRVANKKDVKDGVIAYKIAAHAAIWRRPSGRAIPRQRHFQSALRFRWEDHSISRLDPETALAFMMSPSDGGGKSAISARCAVPISAA